MAAAVINRLRVRGPPELASRTSFLVEDACRTELPDGERLILIRTMALGPDSTARHPAIRAAALRRAYETATRSASHGAGSGAAAANCVWFASRAEARRLLLRELLAGRMPQGWFWRLAVPEWRGQPLARWLGQMFRQAGPQGGDTEAVELLVTAVRAGAAEAVLEALDFAVRESDSVPLASDHLRSETQVASWDATASTGQPVVHLGKSVERLRAALPSHFTEAVESLVRHIGVGDQTSAGLLERLLIKASPSLALSRPLLEELVHVYAQLLVGAEAQSSDRDETSGPPPLQTAPESSRADPPLAESHTERREQSVESRPAAKAADPDLPAKPTAAERERSEVSDPIWIAPTEEASAAAGLWLVLPSLIRMGLREWLGARPELLAADAGRTLIRTIGQHHRVPLTDPVLRPIILDDRPFVAPEWALPWRTGLDRWLRRRAHMPVGRLVWKSGWVRCSEDRLVVRFPLAAADIRLRRRALDVDPGWTDWLGLSVRYLYSESPLS